MNKIKFAHRYPKLWNQSRATLLAVRELNFPRDLNEDFILYDTKFLDPAGAAEGQYAAGSIIPGFYPLENGPYVQLIFVGDKHIPFCTVRPRKGRYGDKKEYYQAKVGQEFEIVFFSAKGINNAG